MNYYQPQFNNPYVGYQPQRFQTPDQQQFNQMQQTQQIQQPIQAIQPTFKSVGVGLQGKSVDSIDVVKAIDIPLDMTISYFPLTDGTAIVTKQLQPDGKSKTIIYKPVEGEEIEGKETPQYLTVDEFNEKFKSIESTKDLKEEIKSLKKQIKNLTDDLDELKDKED